MNRLLLQNHVSVENVSDSIVNYRNNIIEVLESISLESSSLFQKELLALKYFVIVYALENKTKEKRIKENKLMMEVEELGKNIMTADMSQNEKMLVMNKLLNIVLISEDAKNIVFRYRLWILWNIDK